MRLYVEVWYLNGLVNHAVGSFSIGQEIILTKCGRGESSELFVVVGEDADVDCPECLAELQLEADEAKS